VYLRCLLLLASRTICTNFSLGCGETAATLQQSVKAALSTIEVIGQESTITNMWEESAHA
jgi:hypothetical protein